MRIFAGVERVRNREESCRGVSLRGGIGISVRGIDDMNRRRRFECCFGSPSKKVERSGNRKDWPRSDKFDGQGLRHRFPETEMPTIGGGNGNRICRRLSVNTIHKLHSGHLPTFCTIRTGGDKKLFPRALAGDRESPDNKVRHRLRIGG